MRIKQYSSDLATLLENAQSLLGAEAQPFYLSWELSQHLERRLVRKKRRGIHSEPPLIGIRSGRRGHHMVTGIELSHLPTESAEIPLVRIRTHRGSAFVLVWAVRKDNLRAFYRYVRQLLREQRLEFHEPIMDVETARRLTENTINFLRRDHSKLRKFGIPQKRGVLLTGEPGNGKTMACRWLSAQCDRYGLEWTGVSVDEYDRAKRSGYLSDLFQPDRPGIVVFDDFDTALIDRKRSGNRADQCTFLAELDGMTPKTGVVYLFTSNLPEAEVDRALRRPGRLDVVICFERPDRALRERLMRERWHDEIVQQIEISPLSEATEGLSFAEMDELKKQLALQFLDQGHVDWEQAIATIHARDDRAAQRIVGFNLPPMDKSCPNATVANRRFETFN